MILNNAQAAAIASVLSELNNIGGRFSGTIVLDKQLCVCCEDDGDFSVHVGKGDALEMEEYDDQADFFTAYNLN